MRLARTRRPAATARPPITQQLPWFRCCMHCGTISATQLPPSWCLLSPTHPKQQKRNLPWGGRLCQQHLELGAPPVVQHCSIEALHGCCSRGGPVILDIAHLQAGRSCVGGGSGEPFVAGRCPVGAVWHAHNAAVDSRGAGWLQTAQPLPPDSKRWAPPGSAPRITGAPSCCTRCV